MSVNKVTENLKPYPMEELAAIRKGLLEKEVTIYDFGTGDPKIPTWSGIREAVTGAISDTSSYPSIGGLDQLATAHRNYLNNRFGIEDDNLGILPTRGSKEAVFHTALTLVGRAGGKRHVIYPDPGYPVYRSSTLFAGGIPVPVTLKAEDGYMLNPWDLPRHVQSDAAALWINYPHNPTGATASAEYLEKLIAWSAETDTVLLADDCYVDIYDPELSDEDRPRSLVEFGHKNIIAYFSLSKRSGLTGYRAGFMAGDQELLTKMRRARANMGLGQPDFIQAGAIAAWDDEDHVAERRKTFAERMQQLGTALQELGMIEDIPQATFYLWAKIPDHFNGNDVKFCKGLAEKGVIASPSQWLSEGIKGYTRFAMVPDSEQISAAVTILKDYIEETCPN